MCVVYCMIQMDTMLMLKAYMKNLTKSEFHCFLVGAHSTIAGFAFGLFVLFGVSLFIFAGNSSLHDHVYDNDSINVMSTAGATPHCN